MMLGQFRFKPEPGESWRSISESSLEAVPTEAGCQLEGGESVAETNGPTARTEQSNIF